MSRPAPDSPCLNICSLDEAGVCRGCYRTLDEIAGWTRMDPGQQWAVVHASQQRRRANQQECNQR